jgi:hypothetical protein
MLVNACADCVAAWRVPRRLHRQVFVVENIALSLFHGSAQPRPPKPAIDRTCAESHPPGRQPITPARDIWCCIFKRDAVFFNHSFPCIFKEFSHEF